MQRSVQGWTMNSGGYNPRVLVVKHVSSTPKRWIFGNEVSPESEWEVGWGLVNRAPIVPRRGNEASAHIHHCKVLLTPQPNSILRIKVRPRNLRLPRSTRCLLGDGLLPCSSYRVIVLHFIAIGAQSMRDRANAVHYLYNSIPISSCRC